MCGIIGIVSRPPTRPIPAAAELLGGLERALAARPDVVAMTRHVRSVDDDLHGLPGVQALANQLDLRATLTARLDILAEFVAESEVHPEESTEVAGRRTSARR